MCSSAYKEAFERNVLAKRGHEHAFHKSCQENNSGARRAPWVSRFGNPLIRNILVLTSANVRPSVQTLAEGEGSQDNPTGGGGMPSFLVVK